jgi:hypothetical protein
MPNTQSVTLDSTVKPEDKKETPTLDDLYDQFREETRKPTPKSSAMGVRG